MWARSLSAGALAAVQACAVAGAFVTRPALAQAGASAAAVGSAPGPGATSAPPHGAAGTARNSPSTSVYRCEVAGRVVFQQAPCPPGQAGRAVAVPPANVVSAPHRAAAPSSPATGASTPVAMPSSPASAPAPLTDEQACLAYLRPLLRDPQSGRIVSARRDGRVLYVRLQGADARGRLHLRDAACEFVNGRVDDGWSRIQLQRLGWFAPRPWVQGASSEARRAARALEESIEAPTP